MNLLRKPRASSIASCACMLAILFSVNMPARAESPEIRVGRCATINLLDGTSKGIPSGFVDFVVAPVDSNGDGYFEAVLRITSTRSLFRRRSSRFFVRYDEAEGIPQGITVNIGDSETNDGFAGDAATQSNDAEMQIGGLLDGDPSLWDDLLVFGHDGILDARGTQQISQTSNVVMPGELVSITASNDRLEYRSPSFPLAGDLRSKWLFALAGQPDTEGPVNFDLFAGFNRSIGSSARLGAGVARVVVCP